MSMSSVDEEMQQQQKCFIKQILHKKGQKTAIATSGSISTAHTQHINHSRKQHAISDLVESSVKVGYTLQIHHWSVKSRL